MTSIAIIPARGGSKGLPGKNIRMIAGKPLIAWSIEQALAAHCIDHVLVSTDCDQIADISKAHGAMVPFLRPAELATDSAATEPVMRHALDWMKGVGSEYRSVVLLQPTSPLRYANTIDDAYGTFTSGAYDSVVGVVENHHFFWRNDGQAEALYDFDNRPRRQDILPQDRWYRETGSIYISDVDRFLSSNNRLSGRIGIHVMAEVEGWEIDSETDFQILETLLLKVADVH